MNFGNVPRIGVCKKPQEYHPPSGKFGGSTVYEDDFKEYDDIHPPQKHQAPAWKPTADDRDWTSVTQNTYVQHPNSAIKSPVSF